MDWTIEPPLPRGCIRDVYEYEKQDETPVRLRFHLQRAKLYSFLFC